MATLIAEPPEIGYGGGGGEPFGRPLLPTATLGMILALAGISMLFIALTSSYVVRRGFDPTWQAIRMPALLPFNSVLLLISSLSMEKARRAVLAGLCHRWLAATLLLGVAFLAGQVLAWRELLARGIYASTNPHSSFFYLLTGVHGLHLAGGIAAIACLTARAWRASGAWRREQWTGVTAIYWHFMGVLWIYLLVLLFVGR